MLLSRDESLMFQEPKYVESRRENDRHLRVYKPALIECDGLGVVGILRDVSSKGAGFEVEGEHFKVGQAIDYRWGDRPDISGRIVWADAGRIGVLNDEIDADYEAALKRYRSVRLPFSAPANIYVDGMRLAAETLNFAQRGVCALVAGEIRQGALATIEIGRRCFQSATAKWIDGERVGFALRDTMGPGQMNALQAGN